MKYLTIILLSIIAYSIGNSAINKKFAEHLKKVAPFKVAEVENNKFRDWTDEELIRLLGVLGLNETEEVHKQPKHKFLNAPEEYDFRKEHPECMLGILDQGHCGACWSFSSAEALQERFCLQGGENILLSVQNPISCDIQQQACVGGFLDKSWRYFVSTGTVSDSCMPYTAYEGEKEPCPYKCTDGSSWDKRYKAKSFQQFISVETIKNEILNNGPVQAGFMVYEDFYNYESGIYEHTSGKHVGNHAIAIVGWGKEGGINFWICQNSWGPEWGESGYFRIKTQHCAMENNVFAGPADC